MATERPEAEARTDAAPEGDKPTPDDAQPVSSVVEAAAPEQEARSPSAPPPPPAVERPSARAAPSERSSSPPSPFQRPSAPPPASERPPSESPSERPSEPPSDGPRRSRFENILPGLIRRGIEKGIEAGMHTLERSVETGRGTTDAVRGVLSEVKLPRDVANAVGRALTEAKLPRELASAVFSQLDETKNDVLRIVAGEVRDFLDATDIAGELKAALTSLSFEIRTEVRFIPNDAGTGVRPDIRARSRVKRERGSKPPERQRRQSAQATSTPRKGRRERKSR